MGRILKIGVLVAVAALVVIQLVPYGRDHSNPQVTQEAPWSSAQAKAIAVNSCYDCHSNETKWRWYSNVAPMSWLVQQDVEEGRDRLNFTEWDRRQQRDELAEVVEEGSMPPTKYTLIHPGAKLSAKEKATLVAALRDLQQGS